MYRESHLQKKSEECSDLYWVWKKLWDVDKHSLETENARKVWTECVLEHGKMISEEVRTNPRYEDLQM